MFRDILVPQELERARSIEALVRIVTLEPTGEGIDGAYFR